MMNISSHKTNAHDSHDDGGHHKRSVDSGSHDTEHHGDPYGNHGHGYVFQVRCFKLIQF